MKPMPRNAVYRKIAAIGGGFIYDGIEAVIDAIGTRFTQDERSRKRQNVRLWIRRNRIPESIISTIHAIKCGKKKRP